MKENLLLFWGWSGEDDTYKVLAQNAPSDWNIYSLTYDGTTMHTMFDKMSDKVLWRMEKAGLEKASVLGHSMGGALALKFAHEHPERVSKLYLLDCEGIPDGQPISKMAVKMIKNYSNGIKRKAWDNLKSLTKLFKNPFTYIDMAVFIHHVDLSNEARELKTPTVILWGENDFVIPLWQGRKLNELIPGSRLVVLPGMDHDWPLHSPQLFWKNIV